MTDEVKKIAPQIWTEIQQAKNILLHCHVHLDGDSIGGALGMKHILETLGKKVTVIYGDNPPAKEFRLLPGFDEIIPKSFSEINLADYDLFIIQDSGSPNQISEKSDIVFPQSLHTVVIDHHSTNTKYANINLVDPSYISVCEIIYDLLKIWGINLNQKISSCLYTGLYTDSGGFKYQGVTANTLRAASEMAKSGANFSEIIFELENNWDPKAIEFLGLLFSSIEHHLNGHLGLCSVSYADLINKNIDPKTEAPETANMIKSCVGNDIGAILVEWESDVCRLSMRTRDPQKFNVGKIATGTGYGGGHPAAAGARIKLPFNEAKKLFLDTVMKIYPELA